MDTAIIYVYNSLDANVNVTIADKKISLGPDEYKKIEIATSSSLVISTQNQNKQLVEKFTVDASNGYSTYVYNVSGVGLLMQQTVTSSNRSIEEDKYIAFNRWQSFLANTYFRHSPKINRFSKSKPKSQRVLHSMPNLSPNEQFTYMKEDQSFDDLAISHSKWDSEDSKYISQWFDFVSDEDELIEIVDIRLERSPKSLFNLRNQQLYSSEEQLKEVCQKHKDLLNNELSNLDYLYLNIRCIEDRKTRREEYKKAHAKNSTHPMLSYAASYAYMDDENWKKQIDSLLIAYDHILYLRPTIASYLARLYRLLGVIEPGNKRMYQQKAQQFIVLVDPLAISTKVAEMDKNELKQYKLLKQGRIQEAIELSMTRGEGPEFLRQAAASDETSDIDIQTVLMLNSDLGISSKNLWFTIGLYLKHNKNYDSYLEELIVEYPDVSEGIQEFIKGLKQGEIDSELEKTLKSFDLMQRGYAYSLATIALGDKTPKPWREKAKALLFDTERPYFR